MRNSWDQKQEQFAENYNIDLKKLRANAQEIAARLTASDPQRVRPSIALSMDQNADTTRLVPDLEAKPFEDYVLIDDPPAKRIEKNLESALKWLGECRSLRKLYSETARLFIDTHLKGVEFLGLDRVHLEEEKAGVYTLPWQKAEIGLKASRERAARAKRLIEKYNEEVLRYLNSEYGKVDWQTANSDLRYDAGGLHTSIHKLVAGEESAYNMEYLQDFINLTLWQMPNLESQMAINNYHIPSAGPRPPPVDRFIIAGKIRAQNRHRVRDSWLSLLSVLLGLSQALVQLESDTKNLELEEEYQRKNVQFKTERARISRDVAHINIGEYTRSGSPLDYAGQLKDIRFEYDANMERLAANVRSLKIGLKDYYSIETGPLPLKTNQTLRLLTMWLLDVQEKLLTWRQRERTQIYTIWLRQGVSDQADWLKILQSPTGRSFEFAWSRFRDREGLSPEIVPRLRGISIEYAGAGTSGSQPISIILRPPEFALADSPRQQTSGATIASKNIPDIRFGRVSSAAAVSNPSALFQDLFWNGNPNGVWSARLGSDDTRADSIEDIAVNFWVSI